METLEEPTNDEPDVYEIDISPSLDNVIENVINTIESVTKPITEERVRYEYINTGANCGWLRPIIALLCNVGARLHAFIALMIVAIGAGIFSGMPLEKITQTMQNGMGNTGFSLHRGRLGGNVWKNSARNGALDQIAVRLLKSFGEKRANYALGIAGFSLRITSVFRCRGGFTDRGGICCCPSYGGMLLKWRSLSLPVLQGPLPSYYRGQRLCCFC